jgi:hypothetical protein
MNPLRKCTATNPLGSRWLLLVLCLLSGLAQAAVGTVVNVSGNFFAQSADGKPRALAVGSVIEKGDTLITPERTYARVKFTDQGEITLRPGTQMRVDNYAFSEAKPEEDTGSFRLIKGALRSVTGLIGKRGNQDAYKMQTATATIGIRGTNYVAQFVPAKDVALASYDIERSLVMWLGRSEAIALAGGPLTDTPIGLLPAPSAPPLQLAQSTPGQGGGLAPGLYVHVIDGLIQLSNRGGVQQFAAGQFGFTGSVVQPPVIVPQNPGIQFNPPPAFSSSSSGSQAKDSKAGAVDCEVR